MNAPLREVLTDVDLEIAKAAVPKRKVFDKTRSSAKRICSEAPEFLTWVVDDLFPEDVGLVNATGGSGKSTLMLFFAVLYALRRPILGHTAQVPGKVMVISGEDPEGRIGYRLNKIMSAMHLTPEEKDQALSNMEVIDVSDQHTPFAQSDPSGNLVLTSAVDDLIEEYRDQPIRWVIVDPLVSFGPGDRFVNDGLQLLVVACRKLVRHFRAFVLLIHHVNKEVATKKIVGQHSGRGGTALGDGSRFEMQLVQHSKWSKELPVSMPTDVFARGGIALALHIHKITDAGLPEKPYCLTRIGFEFTYYPHGDQVSTADLERNIEVNERIRQTILAYIRKRPEEYLSKTMLRVRGDEMTLESEFDVKMPAKGTITELIDALIHEGRIEVRPLPADVPKHGNKKDYLYVYPLSY